MYRVNLAAYLIALSPLTSVLMCAQSQAPKAHPTSVFSGSHSYLGIAGVDVTDERAKALGLKEPQGVEVTSVEDDSAGLQSGHQTWGCDSGI